MERQRVRILLIEDDPDDVWVMRNLLGDRWDGSFDLVNVELLATALDLCDDDDFDVILLDLGLPDSRGLETFFVLHARAPDVPIVVLSGYNDEAVAIKAVQAGAQDYLVKGQVDDHSLVRAVRYAIERTRRQSAEEALQHTAEEFRAAREIQQRLFPATAPVLPGFDIAGAVHAARSAAGDYYDYIPMDGGALALVVGDVSGHGIGPALLMSETRACLRTLAHSLGDVGEILTRANQLLVADTSDFHFITLLMARLDPAQRTMVYASAGQRGFLFSGDDRTCTLDSTSLPLGVQEDLVVPSSHPIGLNSGDLIAFFTDGLYEAESPRHRGFGIERSLEVIRSLRDKPAAEIVDALYGSIAAYGRGLPQRDDITIVIAKVT
jgi:serine phosphatase RsbU (regulator of sigma subunit)